MVNLTIATDMATSVFTNTRITNIEWAISIFIVLLTMLLLTTDYNKWKILALPVTIIWHIVGITPNFLWYLFVSILFIIEALSLQTVGNLLNAVNIKGRTEIDRAKNQIGRELARRQKRSLAKISTEELAKKLEEAKKLAGKRFRR